MNENDTQEPVMPRLLTVEEVGEITRVSPAGIRRYVAAGELPAVRIGKLLRFRPEDITAWIDSQVVA